MTEIALHEGDNRTSLDRLIAEGIRVHSVVTDPPYSLTSVTKRFGGKNAAPAKFGTDGAFGRASGGFMGHCYHPATDVLTAQGWKAIGEVEVGEVVATLDPVANALVWQPAVATPSFDFDGDMVHIYHRSAAQCITPNHKMLASDRRDQKPWLREPGTLRKTFYQNTQVDPVSGSTDDIKIDIVRSYGVRGEMRREIKSFPAAEFCFFLGLWLGDGFVCARKDDHPANDFFGLAAKKTRKIALFQRALDKIGIRYTHTVADEGRADNFYCYDFALLEWLRPLKGALNKRIPREILNLDASVLEHLYQGLIATDGTQQGKNQELFFTSSRQMVDDFQELCLRTGRSASFYEKSGGTKTICGHQAVVGPSYTCCVLRPGKRIYGENGTRRNGDIVKSAAYRGKVHCITVSEHHTLYTRFDGKPVWSGNSWDATGIERDPEFWRRIYDILLPGGYVLAFSSPRTGHRQACAMEDAGFIMHPFLGWCYGSGFPKAHNASKAIDRELGAKGTFGAPKSEAHAGWIDRGRMRGADGEAENNEGWQRPWMADEEAVSNAARIYEGGSPEARQWEGWAYGAQSLKPAFEPVYVGQKPFSEKNGALNLLKHGVGAMNIDGCRVATNDDTSGVCGKTALGIMNDDGWQPKANVTTGSPLGRHPANLMHDGSPEVVAMFPQSAGQQAASSDATRSQVNTYGATTDNGKTYTPRKDTGSAARFFNCFPTTDDSCSSGTQQEQTESELECEPLKYHAKATKADRAGSKHPTVKPVPLMQHYVRLVTPPGGIVLDPFGGSGTTGEAAMREGFDCILMEADPSFAADIRRRFGLTVTPQTAAPSPFDDLLGGESVDDFSNILG